MVPRSDLEVTGNLKVYEDRQTTSRMPLYRSFCPECGSPIRSDAVSIKDHVFVKAGTLDSVEWTWLKPTVQIFCDSRQTWMPIVGNTRNFPHDG